MLKKVNDFKLRRLIRENARLCKQESTISFYTYYSVFNKKTYKIVDDIENGINYQFIELEV